MKFSATIALFALLFGCVGFQSVPSTFRDDLEFGALVREAKGRYLGVLGYAVSIPGISGFSDSYSRKDVLVIPGTSDFWRTDEEMSYNQRAWKFAEKYNLWLLSTKKPNKAPEPTPGAVTPRATVASFSGAAFREARGAPAPVVAHL